MKLTETIVSIGKIRDKFPKLALVNIRLITLLLLFLFAFVFRLLANPKDSTAWQSLNINLATGFLSSGITFALIDLYIGSRERRETAVEQKRRDRINAIARLKQIHGDFNQSGPWDARQAVLQEMSELDLFKGANLIAINLRNADLANFDMRGTDIRAANFEYADLRGALLSEVNAEGVHLKNAQLTGVDFSNATLVLADISDVGLLFANFEGALLMGADLSNSVFHFARFKNINLRNATGVSERQLASLFTLCGAILPNGKRYDGRYNLQGDLEELLHAKIKSSDTKKIAKWYGVSIETYLEGQRWAEEYLSTLRNGESH